MSSSVERFEFLQRLDRPDLKTTVQNIFFLQEIILNADEIASASEGAQVSPASVRVTARALQTLIARYYLETHKIVKRRPL